MSGTGDERSGQSLSSASADGSPAVTLRSKLGQPSNYSPGTLESGRRRLGAFLGSLAALGSPVKRTTQTHQHSIEASQLKNAKETQTAAATTDRPYSSGHESRLIGDSSRDEVERFPLLRLPDELILKVLLQLEPWPKPLLHLSQTCHHLRQLSQSSILWSRIFFSVPGYRIAKYAEKRVVHASEPPSGSWEGEFWKWDKPVNEAQHPGGKSRNPEIGGPAEDGDVKDLNVASLSISSEGSLTNASTHEINNSDSFPVHFQTLYRSRLLLTQFIQSPSTTHPPSTDIQEAHSGAIYSVRISGRYVFTGSRDQSIKIWELPSFSSSQDAAAQTRLMKTIREAHAGSVLSLDLELDENGKGTFVSCSSDRTAKIWKVDLSVLGKPEVTLKYTINENLEEHTASILDVAFTRTHIVCAGKDCSIRVYDKETYEKKYARNGHDRAVNCLAIGPSKEREEVVSGSADGFWVIWDIEKGRESRSGGVSGAGISCIDWKGEYIVTGDKHNTVRLYKSSSYDCIRQFTGHTALIRAVQIREGEGLIVSGGYDGTVRLWNLRTGLMVRKVARHASTEVFDLQMTATRLIV